MLEKLSVSNMICGADFRFGFNREGSIKNLEEHFNVSISDYTLVNDVRISSSTIKEYITSGNINGANLFLGRNYSLIGKIKDADILDNSTLGVKKYDIFANNINEVLYIIGCTFGNVLSWSYVGNDVMSLTLSGYPDGSCFVYQ